MHRFNRSYSSMTCLWCCMLFEASFWVFYAAWISQCYVIISINDRFQYVYSQMNSIMIGKCNRLCSWTNRRLEWTRTHDAIFGNCCSNEKPERFSFDHFDWFWLEMFKWYWNLWRTGHFADDSFHGRSRSAGRPQGRRHQRQTALYGIFPLLEE